MYNTVSISYIHYPLASGGTSNVKIIEFPLYVVYIHAHINLIIDIAHDIDDDEFAEAEANEPWIQGVLLNLHNLLNNFKPRLSPTSFDQLVSYLTNTVASTLERAVLKTKFTRLGKIYYKN